MRKFLAAILFLASPASAADVNYRTWDIVPWHYRVSPGSAQTHVIDAATDSLQYIFSCKKACPITEVGYLYHARTGTPCAQRFSIQGVSTTTGAADATVKNAGASAVSFTPPASTADDGVWKWRTLGSSYTCTGGEMLAAVIEDVSDGCTPDGSNSSSYRWAYDNWAGGLVPYTNRMNAGVSSFSGYTPIFAYKCGSEIFGFPFQDATNVSIAGDGANDERANAFTIPSGVTGTFKVAGAKLRLAVTAASKTFKIALYQGTTLLQDATFDSDQVRTNAGSHDYLELFFDESSLTTLTAGTQYTIAVQAQGTGTMMSIYYVKVNSSADLAAYPSGTTAFARSRADLAAWTDETDRIFLIEPILTDMTASTGSAQRTKFNQGLN